MQIDSLDFSDPVLTVRCSGTFGIGSKGHPSSKLLTDSIQRWMLSHPQERIEQVIIDYTHVDYEWGDGPVSSMLPIIYKGVTKVRLVANPRNRKQHGAEGAADRVAAARKLLLADLVAVLDADQQKALGAMTAFPARGESK